MGKIEWMDTIVTIEGKGGRFVVKACGLVWSSDTALDVVNKAVSELSSHMLVSLDLSRLYEESACRLAANKASIVRSVCDGSKYVAHVMVDDTIKENKEISMAFSEKAKMFESAIVILNEYIK